MSDDLLQKMLNHFVIDGRLRSCISGTHAVTDGNCLLDFLPLVLGNRIPYEIREKMMTALCKDGGYLSSNGFATESVSSPYYISNGYWRGPIWAPSTWLLIYGLRECGEKELALLTAKRFCDMCAKEGFAENFDAVTGEGLRDRAYTWTSSIFLLLANFLLEEENERPLST